MHTKKNDPAVSNPVHSRSQFEVIYSGSQRGAFELFAARVIRDWNNLANDTVHAKSINIFKVKLRHERVNHTELYIFILITPAVMKSSLYISHMKVQFLTQPVSIDRNKLQATIITLTTTI